MVAILLSAASQAKAVVPEETETKTVITVVVGAVPGKTKIMGVLRVVPHSQEQILVLTEMQGMMVPVVTATLEGVAVVPENLEVSGMVIMGQMVEMAFTMETFLVTMSVKMGGSLVVVQAEIMRVVGLVRICMGELEAAETPSEEVARMMVWRILEVEAVEQTIMVRIVLVLEDRGS